VSEYDLWPIVVESGIRNAVGDRQAYLRLMQYVKSHCSQAVCAFVFKNRTRLPGLIDDIWRWENIDSVVTCADQSLLDRLRVAAAMPCSCGGAWKALVCQAFAFNGVNLAELCGFVFRALAQGRSPTTPVVTLAGIKGGEGKSLFLKGLAAVYGHEHLFYTPQHPAFPLVGLEFAKVVFLDDFRFLESVVPMATQCLWFDGSAVPLAKPQNVPGSMAHDVYHGAAPVFITTKLEDMDALEADGGGEASMVLRRLKVFRFTQRITAPTNRVPECAHCFAHLICSHGQ